MKKLIVICILVVGIAFVAGCIDIQKTVKSQSPSSIENAIVGKWSSSTNDGHILQFFKDGTISASKGGASSVGDYRFVDNTHVRTDFKQFDITATTVSEVSISNNELTVTIDGYSEKYTRVG